MITIPVSQIQFAEGGNTLWVHGPHGGTTIRIKCSGKIITDICKNSPISHCDIIVPGNIEICLSEDAEK